MLRRKVVRFFTNWTSKWNEEIHNEIEKRVIDEFKRLYPDGSDARERIIQDMRSFYYARMATTANILVAYVAVLVSFVSLIVSLVALLK